MRGDGFVTSLRFQKSSPKVTTASLYCRQEKLVLRLEFEVPSVSLCPVLWQLSSQAPTTICILFTVDAVRGVQGEMFNACAVIRSCLPSCFYSSCPFHCSELTRDVFDAAASSR